MRVGDRVQVVQSGDLPAIERHETVLGQQPGVGGRAARDDGIDNEGPVGG